MNHKLKSLIALVLTAAFLSFTHLALARSKEAIKIKKIAIDAGFGGRDKGPIGCGGKIYGKDINLMLAQKLNNKLREEIGLEVLMIRNDDSFITLDERATIANANAADLLISLQTNGAFDTRVYGIETYYLNIMTDESSMTMEEAKADTKDLHSMLNNLMVNSRIEISKRLADEVHNSLIQQLSKKYNHVKDRGIKQAPFYIMVGAMMPAIMVQTSFITNQRECERLMSDDYQNDVVEGIAMGIQKFMVKQEKKEN